MKKSISPWIIYTNLFLISCMATACEDVPRRDYEDFKARTQSLRPDYGVETMQEQSSVLADLRGMWLLNARLSAGIDLGLRVRISSEEWPESLAESETHTFKAEIWLERQDPNTEAPIVIADPPPVLQADGSFTLTANPLVLDPETLNVTTAVEAIVDLESFTKSGDDFCGVATGSVTVPLTLDLQGSTFAAQRDDEGTLTLDDVATRCQDDDNSEAGTEAGSEAGTEAGNDEPTRPELPVLAREGSAPADLSGHWLVNVKLPAPVPLKLWASLIYTAPNEAMPVEGAEGGLIDGTLRRETDPIDAEPLIRFSSKVSSEGTFEVWMPNFVLDGAIRVEGDLLIGGVILPAGSADGSLIWCGEAAGEARSPLMLDLAGTSLYALPWIPGSPAPSEFPNACPNND